VYISLQRNGSEFGSPNEKEATGSCRDGVSHAEKSVF
jgi:hypothetical protein